MPVRAPGRLPRKNLEATQEGGAFRQGAPAAFQRAEPVLDHSLFIDSAWRPAAGGKTFSLTNPATEQRFGRVVDASEADVDTAVKEARTAFDNGSWPRMTPRERAGALETDSGELARRGTMEEGFPRADANGDTKAMLGVLRYYAELADGWSWWNR